MIFEHFMGLSLRTLTLCRSRRHENTETQTLRATIIRWFVESLDQLASVRLDYALGGNVVSIGGQHNELKSFLSCLRQQQMQSAGCISPLSLPGDDRISN